MSGIRLENVIKKIDNKILFNRLSLEIQDGETIMIVGPSGCGKTTLLKIIAGTEGIEAGGVYFRERLINSSSLKTQVSSVFQHYTMYKWSIMNKIMPKLLAHKKWADALEEESVKLVSDIMKISPDEIKGKLIRRLSKGQQQKLDLARYLVTQKNIFLLDDPFAGMDAIIRQDSKAELGHLLKALRITTIFIPSEKDEILEIGDRIAFLEDGKISGVFSIREAQDKSHERLSLYLGE